MAPATLAAPRQKRRAAGGERLTLIFAELRPVLLRTLTLFLGCPDDAQDALQEAFLKCWRRRDRVRRIRNLRAWVYRVSLNSARDLQRNAWRRKARPLPLQVRSEGRPDASPNEAAIAGETLDRLRNALDQLRPEEREVFLLRQNSDLTYEQIALIQDRPVGTVKTQMRAALQKLRSALER
jgi:RNA polymerase sigma-70 factor (ECF subfamily)